MDVRQEMLDKLKSSCIEALENDDRIIVFGEGPCNADIVLVGEAPGEQETKLRRAFVGQAGKNLNQFLEALNLKRENIYITNVVKFRPYKINPKSGRKSNRAPEKDEIELCADYLKKEIEIVRPKVVVTLGNFPLKAFLGNDATVGKYHAQSCICNDFVEDHAFDVFCLYHPASIIYRRELLQTYQEDLSKLKSYLNL